MESGWHLFAAAYSASKLLPIYYSFLLLFYPLSSVSIYHYLFWQYYLIPSQSIYPGVADPPTLHKFYSSWTQDLQSNTAPLCIKMKRFEEFQKCVTRGGAIQYSYEGSEVGALKELRTWKQKTLNVKSECHIFFPLKHIFQRYVSFYLSEKDINMVMLNLISILL